MAKRRPKHKAPVLFGERMRLAYHGVAGTMWVRVYGDVKAFIEFLPGDATFPWRHEFAGRGGALADNQAAAVRLLESLIRRTGRALPAAALVSRKEWRLTNG